MLLPMLKCKIHRATVTDANVDYEGSITIDESILKAVDIIPGEKVEVLNINNGARIETYTIAGKAGSGQICLNGPAARCGVVGDKIIILSYALVEPGAAKGMKTKVVYVDEKNKIRK